VQVPGSLLGSGFLFSVLPGTKLLGLLLSSLVLKGLGTMGGLDA
jgi:hypothetical protein